MKNNKCCPKCNGKEIILVPGFVRPYGLINYIRVDMYNLTPVTVDRYVCCECGYSEEWVTKEDIDKLKDKYEYLK